jgi:predicted transport protein
MTDIQLFRLADGAAIELVQRAAGLERDLQKIIEGQMEPLLGVRFLASEFVTDATHRGRIDSLGIDENGCPVIIEYKRTINENVINQGLFYLSWLLEHRGEFRWLVMSTLGKEVADAINWAGARLLCIASDFKHYDLHAVRLIDRNIELIRYRIFDANLLMLELVHKVVASGNATAKGGALDASDTPESLQPSLVPPAQEPASVSKDKSHVERLASASEEVKAIVEQLAEFTLSLGDDVTERPSHLYTAFRRLKNFVSVIAYTNRVLVMLKVDPSTVQLEPGFSRDVTNIGHWGTGDLELTLQSLADLERAKPLIERSYREH